jgi:hypothetical protein
MLYAAAQRAWEALLDAEEREVAAARAVVEARLILKSAEEARQWAEGAYFATEEELKLRGNMLGSQRSEIVF